MTSKQLSVLDEPLTEAELNHIVKWYEDEVRVPEFATTHDCHVVRALRELLRLKGASFHNRKA